jgi:hypothetical protein
MPREDQRSLLPLSLSQRITASPTLTTSLNKLRRSSLLVLLRSVSQQRASLTRSGQTQRLSARRRKKTSLQLLPVRPSASVSALQRRLTLRLINDLSNLPRLVEVVEVDSVEAEAVVMDNPVVAVMDNPVVAAERVVVVARDVLVEMVHSEPVEAVEAKAKEDHATTLLLPSTPKTRMLSQAWEHKFTIGIRLR